MGIGCYIKRARKEKGMKQKELAQKLNMPISTLANYENDRREPTYETVKKIAAAIGVHEAMLLLDDTDTFTKYSMIQSVQEEMDNLFESGDASLQGIGSCLALISLSINEGVNVYFRDNTAYNAALLELFDSISSLLDYTDHIDTGNPEDVVNGILDLSGYIRYKTSQIYKNEPTH